MKNNKLTTRFGSAVTAGLISTALIAAPLATFVTATPAIAAETKLPPADVTTKQESKAVARAYDGTLFTDLESALRWSDEQEVTLLQDVDETITIDDNLEVTLNLNGHRIASNNETAITNDGKLTIDDSSNGKGSVFGVTNAVLNDQGGTLVINDGTFEGNVGGNAATGEGSITILGGTFSNDVTDYTKPTAYVASLTHGDDTEWVVDTASDDAIMDLVKQIKSGDILTITKTNNDGNLTVTLPDGVTNVTVINNSKGKVYIANTVLNPGERTSETAVDSIKMLRLYNPYSGEHLYTSSTSERDSLVKVGWKDEGIGWTAPSEGDAVYRLYNPYSGDHHYTMDLGEVTNLVTKGWNYEGIGWHSENKSGVPIYRQFNPYAQIGTHNYTTSEAENDHLASIGWKAEGVAWYGVRD